MSTVDYDSTRGPVPVAAAANAGSILGGQRKLLILAVVLSIAFGYFGFIAFQNATSYYLTVDELVERGATEDLESVRVKGKVVPGSFFREENSTIAHFKLADGGQEVAATYDGVLPDLFFNPHSEIVLSGTYDPSGPFATEQVLVKCPSKYRSLEYEEPLPQIS